MTSFDMPSGVEIDTIGGNCPVQAEGRVDGKPFYFRARGATWSLSIGGTDPIGAPEWRHEALYGGTSHAAGWIREHEARAFIAQGVALYRAGYTGAQPPAGDAAAPDAPTHVWVVLFDERDDWARDPEVHASYDAAIAAIAGDPWVRHADYTMDEVLAGLEKDGRFTFYADRDPESDHPYAITLTHAVLPGPSGRTARDTAPGTSDARWVLIVDYDDLPDRIHGAENFRLFRTRADLDAYAATHGLSVSVERFVDRGCQARPIDQVAFAADFRPEAWVNDQAMSVDPEGDTAWEVTPACLRVDARDHDDVVQDPAAPDWIRHWSGPFTLEIFARAI